SRSPPEVFAGRRASSLSDGTLPRVPGGEQQANEGDDVIYGSTRSLVVAESETALQRRLRALEERHLRADVRPSPDAMRALLADDFNGSGSSGRVCDRAATVASVAGSAEFRSHIDDFAVRTLAPDVALTTYRLSAWSDHDGEARVTLRSSVWVHRAGRWMP